MNITMNSTLKLYIDNYRGIEGKIIIEISQDLKYNVMV